MPIDGDRPPCILAIGGHDPAGAGIQADIETCAALGCLAVTVVTALTTQTTAGLHGYRASDPSTLRRQVELLADEFPLAACKLGMVPDRRLADAVLELAAGPLAGLPLVVDPLLRAGSGGALADDEMLAGWLELIAISTVATPNRYEALALTGSADLDTAVARLRRHAGAALLVTDAEPVPDELVNLLFTSGDERPLRIALPRLPGEYHGTGCTLASALACGLARGHPLARAVQDALAYTHRAVERAHRCGTHQAIPNRLAARDA
jgi:hydroxymethylpyrimidine/phosphomethylpyrimidine kinase